MISDERMRELRKLAEHFEDRKLRAKDWLDRDPDPSLYFGVQGLRTDVPEYWFDSVATLRTVGEPPGEIELARALKQPALLSAVARHSHSLRHELVVGISDQADLNSTFTLAWWIFGLLRTRTLADILVPVVADHSWATVAALPERTCFAQLLEDFPQAHRLDPHAAISRGELDWVNANLTKWAELLETPHFRLAVECLTTHHHHGNLRMSAAALWAGFEAIFGINAELRYRLATLAATFLESRGANRLEQYKAIKKHYDFRSKAVHGSPASDDDLRVHIRAVRSLLSRILCTVVEIGRVPTTDDFERLVFE